MIYNCLTQVRKAQGITQRELAALSGVPQNTISDIERGKYLPGMLVALLLARALDCNVEKLFYLR